MFIHYVNLFSEINPECSQLIKQGGFVEDILSYTKFPSPKSALDIWQVRNNYYATFIDVPGYLINNQSFVGLSEEIGVALVCCSQVNSFDSDSGQWHLSVLKCDSTMSFMGL